MGRPKGSPNKVSKLAGEKAQEMGIDPFEILLLFAKGDWAALGYKSEQWLKSSGDKGDVYEYTIDPAVRKAAAADACRYIYPTQKAVELSTANPDGFTVTVKDYRAK